MDKINKRLKLYFCIFSVLVFSFSAGTSGPVQNMKSLQSTLHEFPQSIRVKLVTDHGSNTRVGKSAKKEKQNSSELSYIIRLY